MREKKIEKANCIMSTGLPGPGSAYRLCVIMVRGLIRYTAETEGLKQPRLGYFSCNHKFG